MLKEIRQQEIEKQVRKNKKKYFEAIEEFTPQEQLIQFQESLNYVNRRQTWLEERLYEEAQTLFRHFFNKELPQITIRICGRIKRAGGQYRYYASTGEPLEILISKTAYVTAVLTRDFEVIQEILIHELLHLYLHMEGLPFGDTDDEFIKWGVKLNIEFAFAGIIKKELYECEEGHKHHSHRKFNVERYRCSCGGAWSYKGSILC